MHAITKVMATELQYPRGQTVNQQGINTGISNINSKNLIVSEWDAHSTIGISLVMVEVKVFKSTKAKTKVEQLINLTELSKHGQGKRALLSKVT